MKGLVFDDWNADREGNGSSEFFWDKTGTNAMCKRENDNLTHQITLNIIYEDRNLNSDSVYGHSALVNLPNYLEVLESNLLLS